MHVNELPEMRSDDYLTPTSHPSLLLNVSAEYALCPFYARYSALYRLNSYRYMLHIHHHIQCIHQSRTSHHAQNSHLLLTHIIFRRVPPFVSAKTSTSPLLPTDDFFMPSQHYSLQLLNKNFFLMLPSPLAFSIDLH